LEELRDGACGTRVQAGCLLREHGENEKPNLWYSEITFWRWGRQYIVDFLSPLKYTPKTWKIKRKLLTAVNYQMVFLAVFGACRRP
jgi:hypothetical protein